MQCKKSNRWTVARWSKDQDVIFISARVNTSGLAQVGTAGQKRVTITYMMEQPLYWITIVEQCRTKWDEIKHLVRLRSLKLYSRFFFLRSNVNYVILDVDLAISLSFNRFLMVPMTALITDLGRLWPYDSWIIFSENNERIKYFDLLPALWIIP